MCENLGKFNSNRNPDQKNNSRFRIFILKNPEIWTLIFRVPKKACQGCHFSCNTWTAICVALLFLSWSSRAFYSPIQGFLLYDPRWNPSSPTTGLCAKSPCSLFTPLAINWTAMCVALLLLNWYSRTFFSPIHGFLLHNPCENLSSPSTTLYATSLRTCGSCEGPPSTT